MKYLQKTWVRLLVSLLAVSITLELMKVNSGNPNQQDSNDATSFIILIGGLIVYSVLTALVKNQQKNPFKK
ncbi:hypothetical protein BH11BAC3_BH11BAC3_13740 [soil metagenome]